jgi:ATP-dependent DNA helicase RecG
MYPDGTKVRVSGIVQEDSKGIFLSNPSIEKVSIIPESGESLFTTMAEQRETDAGKSLNKKDMSLLTPIYPETKGVTSLYIQSLLKKALATNILDFVEDTLPQELCKRLHLPTLREALLYIHFPKSEDLTIAARKRFAFEEIFHLQVKQHKEKAAAKNEHAYTITTDTKEMKKFIGTFPFTPTDAQNQAIKTILEDMGSGTPMGRLLEGDVGSGKTFVAAVVAHAVLRHRATTHGKRLQVAYMAPTEILAKQHFESFVSYFKGTGIEIGLLTGNGCKKFPSKTNDDSTSISRAQLLTWIKDGKISIVIGTHALIQKSVKFEQLALVIIDEQHRFGVKQRKALASGNDASTIPHLLSMTATPIPRTLALTMFGDLDLTVIDAMPKNRKKIITEIIKSSKRSEMYEHVRKELQSGRQVYVICPRIDEQDEEEATRRNLQISARV